jgi:hypothetical protein
MRHLRIQDFIAVHLLQGSPSLAAPKRGAISRLRPFIGIAQAELSRKPEKLSQTAKGSLKNS